MPPLNKRKHAMNEAQWEDQQLPGRNQYIVKVLRSTGHNMHMVRKPCGEVYHVRTKLRRDIWAKRGDYVLVEPILEGNKVTAQIVKILNKYCIQFYKLNNIWPNEFVDNKKLQVKDEDLDFFSEDCSDSGVC